MTREQYETLFGQVYSILVFNQKLLEKVRQRVTEWSEVACMGDVFLDASMEMRIYTYYVNNYNRGTRSRPFMATCMCDRPVG
jgi:hypothetical protein